MNTRAHVFIKGKVQGVFFRSWTKSTAESLGLTGFVKNLEDGRVEALFEGEKEKVEEIVNKCKEGSRAAEVTHVDVVWEEALGDYTGFEIAS
jgi:acylphosphatase